MRRFVFLSLALVLLLSLPALAREDETDQTGSEDAGDTIEEPVTVDTIKTEEGVTVNVTIEQPAAEAPAADVAEIETSPAEDSATSRTYTVASPDVLETAQSDDVPSVMADVVTSVLGEYQRQTQTVQELDAQGNVIATSTEYVPGLAGLDYSWIAGAVFFGLFLSGIFKLLGGLMRL